jgi:Zn-dependent protease
MLLAAVNFQDPLFWAIFIGWILSVVLHEFAHGIVAYFGGDWTIRERGGLTLNPLQYIDPFTSLALPAMIFLLGGVPLPGGATYIRRDLIRSRSWQVAVSAAGPAMNFVLFLLVVLPFHPKIGFIDVPRASAANLSAAMLFVGAMAWVQMLSVLFNLVPVPPLDGFGVISQFMDEETRLKFETPPASTILFLVFFAALWRVPALGQLFHNGVVNTLEMLGFGWNEIDFFSRSFNEALFGSP